MDVVIIHGTFSRPERSWFPWLAWQLLRLKHRAYVPRLPTPENQSFDTWLTAFSAQVPADLNNPWIFAHSTGVPFVLKLLQKQEMRLSGLLLVSGFIEVPPLEQYGSIVSDFVPDKIDWEKIRSLCAHIAIFHGSNDSLIPIEYGKMIARNLGVDLEIIEGGGHLNTEAGFTEFPLILEKFNALQ